MAGKTVPELGDKVAIVDLLGNYQAASTAELLRDMGKDVEVFSGAFARPVMDWDVQRNLIFGPKE